MITKKFTSKVFESTEFIIDPSMCWIARKDWIDVSDKVTCEPWIQEESLTLFTSQVSERIECKRTGVLVDVDGSLDRLFLTENGVPVLLSESYLDGLGLYSDMYMTKGAQIEHPSEVGNFTDTPSGQWNVMLAPIRLDDLPIYEIDWKPLASQLFGVTVP